MSTTLPSYSSMMDGRVLRSCGSLEWHTAQSHPSVGTPIDVPLPSTVKVAFIFLWFRCPSRSLSQTPDPAVEAAPARWSLPHTPCAAHKDCSAENPLLRK